MVAIFVIVSERCNITDSEHPYSVGLPNPEMTAPSAAEDVCASDPNFAVIFAFCERFGDICGVTVPTFQELQEMLENINEVPDVLVDLHVKLLRRIKKSVHVSKWERALIKFCHEYSIPECWELERYGYKGISIHLKLKILKALFEAQFDSNPKFKAETNKLESSTLRSPPLGWDKSGKAYWVQFDRAFNLRVYKEDTDEDTWQIVAKDRSTLVNLINELSGAKDITLDDIEDSNSTGSDVETESSKGLNQHSSTSPNTAVFENKEDCSINESTDFKSEINIFDPREYSHETHISFKRELNDEESSPNKVDVPIVGEAIEESVLIVKGEGSGHECDTGNPDETNTQNEQSKNDDVKKPKLWSIETICSSSKEVKEEIISVPKTGFFFGDDSVPCLNNVSNGENLDIAKEKIEVNIPKENDEVTIKNKKQDEVDSTVTSHNIESSDKGFNIKHVEESSSKSSSKQSVFNIKVHEEEIQITERNANEVFTKSESRIKDTHITKTESNIVETYNKPKESELDMAYENESNINDKSVNIDETNNIVQSKIIDKHKVDNVDEKSKCKIVEDYPVEQKSTNSVISDTCIDKSTVSQENMCVKLEENIKEKTGQQLENDQQSLTKTVNQKDLKIVDDKSESNNQSPNIQKEVKKAENVMKSCEKVKGLSPNIVNECVDINEPKKYDVVDKNACILEKSHDKTSNLVDLGITSDNPVLNNECNIKNSENVNSETKNELDKQIIEDVSSKNIQITDDSVKNDTYSNNEVNQHTENVNSTKNVIDYSSSSKVHDQTLIADTDQCLKTSKKIGDDQKSKKPTLTLHNISNIIETDKVVRDEVLTNEPSNNIVDVEINNHCQIKNKNNIVTNALEEKEQLKLKDKPESSNIEINKLDNIITVESEMNTKKLKTKNTDVVKNVTVEKKYSELTKDENYIQSIQQKPIKLVEKTSRSDKNDETSVISKDQSSNNEITQGNLNLNHTEIKSNVDDTKHIYNKAKKHISTDDVCNEKVLKSEELISATCINENVHNLSIQENTSTKKIDKNNDDRILLDDKNVTNVSIEDDKNLENQTSDEDTKKQKLKINEKEMDKSITDVSIENDDNLENKTSDVDTQNQKLKINEKEEDNNITDVSIKNDENLENEVLNEDIKEQFKMNEKENDKNVPDLSMVNDENLENKINDEDIIEQKIKINEKEKDLEKDNNLLQTSENQIVSSPVYEDVYESADETNEDMFIKSPKEEFNNSGMMDHSIFNEENEKKSEAESVEEIPKKKGRPGRKKGKRGRAKKSTTVKQESKTNTEEKIKRTYKPRQKKVVTISEEVIVFPEPAGDDNVRRSRRIAEIKIKEQFVPSTHYDDIEIPLKSPKKKDKGTKKGSTPTKKMEIAEESDDDEEDPTSKKFKKRKRKGKPDSLKKLNVTNPWNVDSESSSSENIIGLFEDYDHEEEDEIPRPGIEPNVSDHEFSPESDINDDDDDYLPEKRARTAHKKDQDEQLKDDMPCQNCKKSDQPEWILLCDTCNQGWHASCLRPPLMVIPDGDWYCPPCRHNSLLIALKDVLKKFDEESKKRENEELRRKRLAYVGISLQKVISKTEEIKTQKQPVAHHSSEDDEEESESDSYDSEPLYQLRARRQANVSYRFNDYDDMINEAILEETGVDESAAKKSLDMKTDKNDNDEKTDSDNDENDRARDDSPIAPALLHLRGRKKSKKLTNLDISSDDGSDEDFKGPSDGDDDYEEEFSEYSDDSVKKRPEPTRRSVRNRKTVVDPDFINDDSSEESDYRVKKKRSRPWSDSSNSEEEDLTWGKKKKNRIAISSSTSVRLPKGPKRKRENEIDGVRKFKNSKIKYGMDSDSDSYNQPKRRTRGRQITYAESDDSEQEIQTKKRKVMSDDEDEFVLNDEELEAENEDHNLEVDEEDAVASNNEKYDEDEADEEEEAADEEIDEEEEDEEENELRRDLTLGALTHPPAQQRAEKSQLSATTVQSVIRELPPQPMSSSPAATIDYAQDHSQHEVHQRLLPLAAVQTTTMQTPIMPVTLSSVDQVVAMDKRKRSRHQLNKSPSPNPPTDFSGGSYPYPPDVTKVVSAVVPPPVPTVYNRPPIATVVGFKPMTANVQQPPGSFPVTAGSYRAASKMTVVTTVPPVAPPPAYLPRVQQVYQSTPPPSSVNYSSYPIDYAATGAPHPPPPTSIPFRNVVVVPSSHENPPVQPPLPIQQQSTSGDSEFGGLVSYFSSQQEDDFDT